MNRIQVEPTALMGMAGRLRREAAVVQGSGARLQAAVGALAWQSHRRSEIDEQVERACRHADLLGAELTAMAAFVEGRAAAFRAADADSSSGLDEVTRMAVTFGRSTFGLGVDPLAVAAAAGLVAMGSMVGVGSANGATYTMGAGDLRRRHPELYDLVDGHAPAAPVEPWGGAPVVGGSFAPSFQGWVTKLHEKMMDRWKTSEAAEPYLLTPHKVERLWQAAEAQNVDPRFLLGILMHEGTGSFNTSSANADSRGGHGPESDWERDLRLAVEGPIGGKLRLYPQAVEAGFQGSWVEWINLHGPMDTPDARVGVYAEDIGWHIGVERAYRGVVTELGSTNADPVTAFNDWMATHPEQFQPKYIDETYEVRPGNAPGAALPEAALWHESKPPAGAVLIDNFWRFPASPEWCWHFGRT